jgi:hypothetical protein
VLELNATTPQLLAKIEDAAPKIVAFDGNPSSETITAIVEKSKQLGAMSEFNSVDI